VSGSGGVVVSQNLTNSASASLPTVTSRSSRFFRDHFELEFYVRKLAKNGVWLVSMTQELGDDPTGE